jgi:hypothetical protein
MKPEGRRQNAEGKSAATSRFFSSSFFLLTSAFATGSSICRRRPACTIALYSTRITSAIAHVIVEACQRQHDGSIVILARG